MRGHRPLGKNATRIQIGYFRVRLCDTVMTHTQLSVPKEEIAWSAKKVCSFSQAPSVLAQNSDAPLN